MSSHQLAIAKASFSAGLLRPDPRSVSRDDISQFHSLLSAVVAKCSSTNVQKCKRWILSNVVQSPARFTALGKYLTAISTSFTTPVKQDSATATREPSPKRKRLHLLYLINDLLYHAKVHSSDASLSSKVQPFLVELFSNAASFKDSPKHFRKISELLNIWEEKKYYSNEYIDKLREAVRNASEGEGANDIKVASNGNEDSAASSKAPRSAPYVMPAMHGDHNTPWYDLPAGNLMPHIVPNSTRPINPALVKPLQFVAGPADETLAAAVRGFLKDVDVIFGVVQDQDRVDDTSYDIDELGQPILRDEITNEVVGGEGYYGWSKMFCEKMKRRHKGIDAPGPADGRESRRRSRSRSQSSSGSDRSYKRRRYTSSDYGEDRSRGRHSLSRSRSPSMERGSSYHRGRRSPSSPSKSSSQTRSRTRSNHRSRDASRSSFNDISRSYDAPQGQSSSTYRPQNSDPRYQHTSQQPPPAIQSFGSQGDHHFGPGGMPIPPPPPPNYQGQWPPPPPPPIMPYGQAIQAGGGVWPPLLPPVPPILSQGQYSQGTQPWQQQSFAQQSGGGWPNQSQQAGHTRGGYDGRGRGGGGTGHHYNSGRGTGFNGYGGQRGNHRGGGGGWS